ncbi:hypothetical protein CEP51_001610 [Fusarium floridanum]|uniref:Uncharacterized protein n=1 Tax=Fusarium floridanum TaxID=1325733 RepID=A0A428SFZ8_9HYPO|nr:hypothetical protein CEP51_001610 [Fusarium floridanum]
MNGKDAVDQRWVIRVGTGFAFLVKACFAASLGIVIKQLVWTMLRKRFMSLRGIDALFAITTDPTAFLVHDIWMGMPCLVLLTVLLWGIPLAAIVTPATVSVTTVTTRSNHSCDIPVLNFEKRFDWKYRTPQSSLANYNETLLGLGIRPPLSEYGPDEEGNDVADPWQYGGPTPVAEKLLRKVVIGQEILPLNVTFVNDVRRLQVVGEEFVDRVPWPMFPGNMSLSATYKESNFWAYQALADLAIEMLRHLPYFDSKYTAFIQYKSRLLDSTTFARIDFKHNKNHHEGLEFWSCEGEEVGPMDVVHIAGVRESYGRELWLNVNDCEIIEYVIRADTREPVEIEYYFESLKEAYRKLEHIPCRGRVTTEAEDIPERESDITMEEYVRQIYRQHGRPKALREEETFKAVDD